MKIGIIGSGVVAQSLGSGFVKHGHDVVLGTRDPSKLADWAAANPPARVVSPAEAAAFAEVAVLAVKGGAALAAVRGAGPENLAGKTVIDTTNPIADAPPVDGVLKFTTTLDDSLLEQLQRAFPAIKFVKAFNSVGSDAMVDPQFAGGKPSMFVAGDDAAAKSQVASILDQFGWETEDMGGAVAARAIEPLCILWCIPGFLRGDWRHAFKVLR